MADHAVDVVALGNGSGPVRVAVGLGVKAGGYDVEEFTLPAMAAFVPCSSVEDGLVGDALKVEIESGVHAKASSVDLLDAVLLLQLPPDFFDKVRGDAVRWGLDSEAEWLGFGFGGLGGGDLVVLEHLVEDKIATMQGTLRVAQGGVEFGALGHGGK